MKNISISHPNLLVLAILAILIAITGCSLKSPESPQWETNLLVPLLNEHYRIEDLIEDTEDFSLDSLRGFIIDKNQATVNSNEMIEISNMSTNNHVLLEDLEISVQDEEKTVSDTLFSVNAAIKKGPPYQAKIAPFKFSVSHDLKTSENFHYLILETGVISIHIINGFPVPVFDQDSPDRSHMEIRNWGEPELIYDIAFDKELGAGESRDYTITVSQKKITSILSITLYCSSAGSRGTTVLIDPYSGLETRVKVQDPVKIKEGELKIKKLEHVINDRLIFTDSLTFSSIKLSNGVAGIQVWNSFPVPVTMQWIFENIRFQGNKYEINENIQGFSSVSSVYPLKQTEITPETEPQKPEEKFIRLQIKIAAGDQGEKFYTLSGDNSGDIMSQVGDIEFEKITGKFGNRVKFEGDTVQIEIPENLPDIEFQEAVGYVDFRSYFTTPLNLDLLLHGSEDKAVPVTGAVAGRLSGSTEPAETRIMLDEEPLKDLLSIWPREMYSDGHIVVNDGMTEREIARTDSLESRLHIEVPLHMIIAPDIDTLDVMGGDKIDEDTRDDINKRCRLGRIVVGCRNHFPLAFSITAMAGNDSAEIFENPEVIFNKGEDFYVAPAIIDDNGISVDKSEQIFDTDLTMEEIKALCSDEKIYMGIILNQSGTGGKPVKILHDDYLEIRAHLEVKLLVGE